MASIVRPTLLRQHARLATVSKRCLSSGPSIFPSVTAKKPIPSLLSKPLVRNAFVRSAFVRNNVGAVRVAAFHASARRELLPAGPQNIDGTVNDAAKIPPSSPSHGSYHWTFERLISVGLVPLTIAPFVSGSLNPVTDALLVGLVIIHSHIGFDALIVDYIPNRKYPTAKKVFDWALRLATLTVAVGLYEFETNDVGVTEALKRIWSA